MAPPTETPPIGDLVRLHAYAATRLPAHPDLAIHPPSSDVQPDLQQFIASVLAEGDSFITKYLPSVVKVRTAKKTVPPSKATVQLAEHYIPESELPATAKTKDGESWFMRSSLHVNEKATGTGDWEEFEKALLDRHSQHEMDYTPDVFDAHYVLGWDDQLQAIGNKVGEWEKVEMNIFEMAHKIPPPLGNRVFPVLVVKAKNTTKTPHSFIVVQFPVEITNLAKALYANGRHKTQGDNDQKKKAVVMGVYTSVERCELHESSGHVKWHMATASDAKGNLPLFIQKRAIPDAIAKDVALVVDWLDKKRKGTA